MHRYDLVNFHPTKDNKPVHIGLIADGTGRWGKINNISVTDAYMYASDKMTEFINFFFEKEVPIISIYLSSIQNFRRPQEIIDAFCLAQEYFVSIGLTNLLKDYPGTQIIPVGNMDILPIGLRNALLKISTQQSAINKLNRKIYLCVAYNPLEEVLQAIESPQRDDFPNNLCVKEPLDLVIRTSGANLLSNFLPLQSGYARLYWLEKLYPDVSIEDYESIYNDFIKLERKYGD